MNLPPALTEFEKDLIDVLLKHNVIDKRSIRNFLIKQKYIQLSSLKDESRKNQYSKRVVRHIVADEFFISEWTVQKIIYYK